MLVHRVDWVTRVVTPPGGQESVDGFSPFAVPGPG